MADRIWPDVGRIKMMFIKQIDGADNPSDRTLIKKHLFIIRTNHF